MAGLNAGMSNTEKDLIPLNVAARRLKVPVKWLRAEAETGRVPAINAAGRWLCSYSAVEAALLNRAKGGEQ